ncbi:MAG TPA: hypothetical protein VF411_02485 [Bacteroidia bacterium]
MLIFGGMNSMITDISEISDLFSIFHDGSISKYINYSDHAILHIDCMYLAERFDEDFDHFILKIYGIKNIELKLWAEEENQSPIIIDSKVIFQIPLDIQDGEVKSNNVVIHVGANAHPSLDNFSGDLSFECSGVEIFDPKLKQLTFKELVQVCEQYWKDFENRK